MRWREDAPGVFILETWSPYDLDSEHPYGRWVPVPVVNDDGHVTNPNGLWVLKAPEEGR